MCCCTCIGIFLILVSVFVCVFVFVSHLGKTEDKDKADDPSATIIWSRLENGFQSGQHNLHNPAEHVCNENDDDEDGR